MRTPKVIILEAAFLLTWYVTPAKHLGLTASLASLNYTRYKSDSETHGNIKGR